MAEEKVIDINELVPDDLNANAHTARGEAMLEDSLKRHKAGRSILIDKNGKIIAGNATVEAAKKAGITKVRVIQTSGDEVVAHRRSDLDLDEAATRELALADNRIGQVNLEWDGAAFAALQERGVTLENVFLQHEMEKIVGQAQATAAVEALGDDAESEPGTKKKGGGAAAPAVSAVRMVQLFFDQDTFERFDAICAELEGRFGTESAADTVLAAMRQVLFNSDAATAAHAAEAEMPPAEANA